MAIKPIIETGWEKIIENNDYSVSSLNPFCITLGSPCLTSNCLSNCGGGGSPTGCPVLISDPGNQS